MEDLVRSAKSDSTVSSNLANVLLEYGSKKPNLTACDNADSYFAKLNLKDLQVQSAKIKEYALVYFNNGNFSQFNIVFTKFIKNLKELNNIEMNGFIINYLISSTLKKNYDNAISDLTALKQYFTNYDLNIYI